MSEKEALAFLKEANFRPAEPFHAKMSPWLMECLVCRNIFKRRLRDVINGFGCKYCNGKAWNADMAVARMLESGLKPIEPYKTATHQWAVLCKNCGKNSKVALSHIVSGSRKGCKHCSLDLKQDFEAKELVIFEKIRKLDYSIIEGEKYRGKRIPIKVKCLICEVESNFIMSYLTDKSVKRGCKTCANNQSRMSIVQLGFRSIAC